VDGRHGGKQRRGGEVSRLIGRRMVVRFFPFPFPTSSDGAMAFYVPLPFDDREQAAPGKVLRLEVSFFLPGVLVRFLCKLVGFLGLDSSRAV
jgi:hypothetical protein